MRSLLIATVAALSVVSGQLTDSTPPLLPCQYDTTSFTLPDLIGQLNTFKFDYSGNVASQNTSCDISLRCPATSNMMTLLMSLNKGNNTADPKQNLFMSVNNSHPLQGWGWGQPQAVAVPLTPGEGVGINIWGNAGYAIVQATCHTLPGGVPSQNSQIRYVLGGFPTGNMPTTVNQPDNAGWMIVPNDRRPYASNTTQVHFLFCNGGTADLAYGTPAVQINSIAGSSGSDDSMTIIATDSNIRRQFSGNNSAVNYTTGGLPGYAEDRSSFEMSSMYLIQWTSGATNGTEPGFNISITCRNATGFTTSGAGAGLTASSGAAATLSAAAAAFVAILGCFII